MKTIEQLLALSDNPYYKFTQDEQAVLDDFLLKKREKDSQSKQKKSSETSENDTPVRVRNVVEKTIDDVPEVNS